MTDLLPRTVIALYQATGFQSFGLKASVGIYSDFASAVLDYLYGILVRSTESSEISTRNAEFGIACADNDITAFP